MLREKLTQERLKEFINYDPGSGVFSWIKKTSKYSNIKEGAISGSIDSNGYRLIQVDGHMFKASRLAVLYMDGYIPENEVDHINRKKDDDRWDNLRVTSRQCNVRNRNLFHNNKSGITGVYWDKSKNRWRACIGDSGKTITLGTFFNKTDAIKARFEAEKKYGYPRCDSASTSYLYLKKIGAI